MIINQIPNGCIEGEKAQFLSEQFIAAYREDTVLNSNDSISTINRWKLLLDSFNRRGLTWPNNKTIQVVRHSCSANTLLKTRLTSRLRWFTYSFPQCWDEWDSSVIWKQYHTTHSALQFPTKLPNGSFGVSPEASALPVDSLTFTTSLESPGKL